VSSCCLLATHGEYRDMHGVGIDDGTALCTRRRECIRRMPGVQDVQSKARKKLNDQK
jgi:hypothetical protein